MTRGGLSCAALTASFLLVAGGAAQAQSTAEAERDTSVVLRSVDGSAQLAGKLIEYDGQVYTVTTALGLVRIEAGSVICDGPGCPGAELFGAKFGVYGSSTIGTALLPALVEGYADTLEASFITEVGPAADEAAFRIVHSDGRPMATIDVKAHGSAAGFEGLGAGAAEIAMSSRRLNSGDLAVLRQSNISELRDTENEHVIAVDGLVAIVHPDNPLQSVSLEELALLFSGSVTNWSQLGGPDIPVQIYVPGEKTGNFDTLRSLILSEFDVSLSPLAKQFDSNVELADRVASDRAAIGVTAIAYSRSARILPIRQECGMLSFPTSFTMKTEEYPLTRRLYLYTPSTRVSAHVRNLIDFVKSEAAQPLIDDVGFVSEKVESLPMANQGGRLIDTLAPLDVPVSAIREMVAELGSASRLSLALRFTPGSSFLDSKSANEVKRLAARIAAGEFGTREILLVGFTDSVGEFAANQGLSFRRASAVEVELRAAVEPGALDPFPVRVLGFGELSPVGCNTTAQGRTLNRRVEVWLRDPPR